MRGGLLKGAVNSDTIGKKITTIIPAYNETKTIAAVVTKTRQLVSSTTNLVCNTMVVAA
jgi:hypothetical protein